MALIQTGTSSKIELFFPNRDRNGALVHNAQQFVDLAVAALSDFAGGGCSLRHETGYWAGRSEATAVVYAYVPASADLRARVAKALEPLLQAYKRETNQEAVALTIDGQWYAVVGADGAHDGYAAAEEPAAPSVPDEPEADTLPDGRTVTLPAW